MPSRKIELLGSRKRHQFSLIATGILAAVIAYLTLSPAPVLEFSGGDKIHHMIGFAALSLPASILYRRALFWVLPGVVAFGGAIELIQPYVNRRGEWGDFWADVIGVSIGVAIGLFIRRTVDK